jgi:Ion channel
VNADEIGTGAGRGRAPRHPARPVEPKYRYSWVFSLMLALVIFLIAAPSAKWSRGISTALAGLALIIAVRTARTRETTRRNSIVVVAVACVFVIVGIATGYTPGSFTFGFGVVASAAVPLVIVRGVVQLLRRRGVTLQAVAGALTVYLAAGLTFAWLISLIAEATKTPYFAQHTSGTLGERVYFSFTTLTTTGYGDFSPATATGHALAVLEMITGQLYLVTVVGLLVGSYVGSAGSATGN